MGKYVDQAGKYQSDSTAILGLMDEATTALGDAWEAIFENDDAIAKNLNNNFNRTSPVEQSIISQRGTIPGSLMKRAQEIDDEEEALKNAQNNNKNSDTSNNQGTSARNSETSTKLTVNSLSRNFGSNITNNDGSKIRYM